MAKSKTQEEEMMSATVGEVELILDQVVAKNQQEHTVSTLYMEGKAGIGKSQIVRKIATKYGAEICDIRLGENADPSDMLMKLPNLEQTDVVQIVLKSLPRKENSILFLDEIRHASEDLRHLAFQLCLDHRLGNDYHVPPGTTIVAASNPTDETSTEELDSPLFDRFKYRIHVHENFNEWAEFIENKGYPFGSVVTSYLKNNKDSFHVKPEHGRIQMTPRRWEWVIQDMPNLKMIEAQMNPGLFITFSQFVKKVEMFKNVDDYIEGKKACPKDVGDQWAIHAAIISRITNDTKSYEDKCFAVFEERFVGMDTDIQASTMLSTLKTYLGRKKMSLPDLVMKIPANRKTVLTKVVSKYNYVAAGVMQTA